MAGPDETLYEFYEGYFTGPHYPERPWPPLARLEAEARLAALKASTKPSQEGAGVGRPV